MIFGLVGLLLVLKIFEKLCKPAGTGEDDILN
jgi:hypothetical protein